MTKVNIQPKQQNKCMFFFYKPFFKKGAFTNHMKKAHNISKTTTKYRFMKISENIDLYNNDINIEVDKLEMENSFILENAKEQE